MKTYVKPQIAISGDSQDLIMWKKGEIVAKSSKKALWRFGFNEDSPLAKEYGVFCPDSFVWVMADPAGNILKTFTGWFSNIPVNVKEWCSKNPASAKVSNELRKERRLHNQYKKEIAESFDWQAIKQDCQDNLEDDIEACSIPPYPKRGMSFLGTVFSLMPSGKFYTCWTTNQTEDDEYKDSIYREALESVAGEYDLSIENGEGDPCDLFAVLYTDDGDSDGYVL